MLLLYNFTNSKFLSILMLTVHLPGFITKGDGVVPAIPDTVTKRGVEDGLINTSKLGK